MFFYLFTIQTDSGSIWLLWNCSCQVDVMQLIDDLELSVYPQYTSGAKLQQLNSSARVSRYTGEIPSLPFYALIDLHLFMRKVGYWRFEP